jgi:methylmalonyl-CoA mutase cobalamin-binding subunit
MALSLCLINPPPFYKDVPAFPIGIGTIAATARSAGHEVDVLDMAFSNWSAENVIDWLARRRPDLVGIASIYTCTADATLNLLRSIREAVPNLTIVVGGRAMIESW